MLKINLLGVDEARKIWKPKPKPKLNTEEFSKPKAKVESQILKKFRAIKPKLGQSQNNKRKRKRRKHKH